MSIRLASALAFLALLAVAPAPAPAAVEKLEIVERQGIADGHPFGLAGPYEKITAKVTVAVDPADPHNRGITDLDLAPRGEDGLVRATADLVLLQPVDGAKGNGTLLLEVPNRGGKAAVFYFNRDAGRTRDPITREDFGDGFLMRHGFTVAWVGWQVDVPQDPSLLRLEAVPVVSPDGEPIRGLARADHVFSEPATTMPLGHRGHRSYTVADPADERNVLTVRDERLGERRAIPRSRWRFVASGEGGRLDAVELDGGFLPGKIYEVVWVAQDPVVVGLGLAAIRDVASYLKHGEGSPATVERAIGLGISQTGRFLRHFLWLGMNEDEAGRTALDGVLAHTAGAGRGSFSHRFAQPSRDAHAFSAFFYPTDVFPFTGSRQTDQVSGRTDSLIEGKPGAASAKIFFTNTGYEYWGRAASLLHTTVAGDDLAPLPNVRIYHLAGAQHFVDRFPPQAAETRHPANPLQFLWAMRGLLVALEEWVAHDTEPPPSLYPKAAEGSLVPASELAFPAIPGVAPPELPHLAYRMDYGPRFWTEGIVDRQPPVVGEPFPVQVPQVDADGNERSGLRLPELAVPLATYAPWNFRAKGVGAPDETADFRGSFLPLPRTEEDRRETGDPRRSVEARYGNEAAYLGLYARAAADLVRRRYLVAEDLPEMLAHAEALWDLVAGQAPTTPAR